jgi:hypothetical protein
MGAASLQQFEVQASQRQRDAVKRATNAGGRLYLNVVEETSQVFTNENLSGYLKIY